MVAGVPELGPDPRRHPGRRVIPAQLIRFLRPVAVVVGLRPPEPDDDATHGDLLDLLDEVREAVERDQPGARSSRASPAGWGAPVDRIRELAAAGRSDPEIARALGSTAAAVRSVRRRHQIAAGTEPGPPNRGRVPELHAAGRSVSEIAEELGIAPSSVHQALYRHRLATREEGS